MIELIYTSPIKYYPINTLFNLIENEIGIFTQEDDDQKVAIMRKAFQMFDTGKTGFIDTIKIATILNTMGQLFDESELQALINENDPDCKSSWMPHIKLSKWISEKEWMRLWIDFLATGKVNFDGFSNIAGHFLEEEDGEAMQQELKEAFRLYDREGNGYITTSTLKEILAALDDKLNNSDLDGIIAEIDTDGSGTVDFDGMLRQFFISNSYKYIYRSFHSVVEFMEMMTGD